METLTVNELFSGIGAQRKALERLGINHEVVGISEIDKYAIQSYEAIYGKTYNYGDISKVEKLNYADLWTYSFPCQDISVAGKQQGISQNTRSGLLYQVQRLLEVAKDEGTLPKYLLLENVKNLVGKQFKSQFDEWLFYLDELGYDTYWQVLNAKNFGIPQNRERVFAISIRKDLNQSFEFPQTEELTIRLKDVLEEEVDERFYLNNDKIERFIKQGNVNPSGKGIKGNVCTKDVCNTLTTNKGEGLKILVKEATLKGYAEATIGDSINIEQPNSQTRRGRVGRGVAQTLTTSPHQVVLEPKIQQVGNYMNTTSFGGNPQCGRVYNSEGISPTLNTMQGGDRQPKIVENKFTKNKNVDLNVYREMVVKNNYNLPIAVDEQNVTVRKDGTCGTLTTDGSSPKKNNRIMETDFRIRKLTPLECWRLMGFDDEDFYAAKVGNKELAKEILDKYPHEGKRRMTEVERISKMSNTQLYKQAGNSIVVNVLEKIFKKLF